MDNSVASVFIEILLDGKAADKDIKKLKKQFADLSKSFNRGFLAPLLKVAGIAAFSKMAIDAGKLGRQMGILSERTGVSVKNLSAMRNAFKSIGGDAEVIDKVVGGLSKGLARLSRGDGQTAAKLAAMNISAWGPGGKTRKPDELLFDIADWTQRQLASGRTEEEVATYLEDAFGIDYKLFKQLSKGGAEYRRIMESTPKLTNEQNQNLERMNLAFARLSATFGVVIDQVTATLAPVFEWIADALADFGTLLSEFPGATTAVAALVGIIIALKAACMGWSFVKGIGALIAYFKGGSLFAGATAGTAVAANVAQGAGTAVAAKGGLGLLGMLGLGGLALGGGAFVGYEISKTDWFKDLAEGIGNLFSSNSDNPNSPQHWENVAQQLQEKGNYEAARLARMKANQIRNDFDKIFNPQEDIPVVWADQVDGTEVMKASDSAGDTFVDVAVENNWIENPDGTYTIMTDVDVNSSDGNSFTTSISKALDGGYA